jgi:hypothetical protein
LPQPKVLLLAGFPNSGTTIASYVIDQHGGVFVAGELADFPAKQLKAGKLCACGSPAASCGFWNAVLRRLEASAGEPEAARRGALYRAIGAESGAALIVDVAHDLRALREAHAAEGIDLYLVHLRRQGRAVLNSRMRRFGRPDEGPAPSRVRRLRRAFRHVIRWRTYDRVTSQMRLKMGEQRAIAVQYETLCSQPDVVLGAVGRLTGLDFTGVGDDAAAGKPLKPMSHMIRGNPRLKAKTAVCLAADEGFKSELTFGDRVAYLAGFSLAPAVRRRG